MFRPFYVIAFLSCFPLQVYALANEQTTYTNGINSNAPVYRENNGGRSNQTTTWGLRTATGTSAGQTTTLISAGGGEYVASSLTVQSNTTPTPTPTSLSTPTQSPSKPTPTPTSTNPKDPITTIEITTTMSPPLQIITKTTSSLTTTTAPTTASPTTPTPPPERSPPRKYPPAIIAALSGGCASIVLCLSGLTLYIWIRRRQMKEPEFIPEPMRSPRSPPPLAMYLEGKGEDTRYIDIEKEEEEMASDTDAIYAGKRESQWPLKART